MSKRKKTRQQKIIADLKRNLLQSQSPGILSSPKSHEPEKPFSYRFEKTISPSHTTSVITYTHTHLIQDLLKTAYITGVILAFEFVLFFFGNK